MTNETLLMPSDSDDQKDSGVPPVNEKSTPTHGEQRGFKEPADKTRKPKKPPTIAAGSDERTSMNHPDKAQSNAGFEDPFSSKNLSKMRLSQDFATLAGVKPVITNISVRKPNKHEFIRVRNGPEWRFETGCFIDRATNDTYLVTPELWSAIPGDVTPTALVIAISRNSPVPFLWPLKLPSSDGRANLWNESGIEAARIAERKWLRCAADMGAGCYVPYVASADFPEPEWPADLKMEDYLRLAFQGRFIDDISHTCLKRLRGEI